ncbi:MAG TPA: TetR/AcrR family transcriptional regulator [Solirubrobacteraceae bacterium]|nr:TetR/AcrR family transcriptional regulator [Solirubrobacteraceae bacterium]
MALAPRDDDEQVSFSPLPPGRHGLDRRAVGEHQRERIVQAMTQMVLEDGFQGLTIARLCKRARVTERAFYRQFASLEWCFLAAYESIVESYLASILEAYDATTAWDEALERALRAVLETAAEQPRQARLLLVEAPTAGQRGVERARGLTDTLQAQVARHAQRAPGAARVPELIVRGIVGGIRDVIGNRLATNSASELPQLVEPLLAWILSYVSDSPLELGRAPAPRRRRAAALAPQNGPPPLAGHGHPREFVRENQRQRLMDATAAVSRERGYAGLTVSAIARRARVSHKTFYEHFTDRNDAFLSTYRYDRRAAFAIAERGYAGDSGDWPRELHRVLHALLDWLAERPDHAHLGFVAFPATGANAHFARRHSLQMFSRLLAPGYGDVADVPAIAGEAIAGAVFEMVAEEIVRGRAERLPELSPLVSYIVLAPFVGAVEAADVARERPGQPAPAAGSGV